MKRVAVIGGGIFGTTAAIHAARMGHEVHLFETLSDIMQAASGINQYRLHRGYHYPRSSLTARSAIKSERSFLNEYGDAVIQDSRHYYAIAKEGSLVSGSEFLAFCKAHELPYTPAHIPHLVNHSLVEFVIEGVEFRLDIDRLRKLVRQKLQETGVVLHFNATAGAELDRSFDFIIVAAYANTASAYAHFTESPASYQYEVCEKPVVEMPHTFGKTGLVILDGPFMCVDPFGHTGKFVLGNVVHAIHASNIGFEPIIPPDIAPLLNRGIIENPPVTNFQKFIESGARFIPPLAKARHIGSMYTVRTVLPRMERTDGRPTFVSIGNGKHIKIFSGKISNCVEAAKEACQLIASANGS